MSDKSKIPWTDATWNPVVGCTKVSAGCANCYAEKMAYRLACMGQKKYQAVISTDGGPWNGEIYYDESVLDKPLHWKKPRRIFVCSMGDLCHTNVPFEFIDKVVARVALCPQHDFQFLTKRPDRMLEYFNAVLTHKVYCENTTNEGNTRTRIRHEALEILHKRQQTCKKAYNMWDGRWPLRNLWLGTSISTQADADENIPHLLPIPATVRFVSAEPLLGPIDLTDVHEKIGLSCDVINDATEDAAKFNRVYGKHLDKPYVPDPTVNWLIIGCESGKNRRPCKIEWVRDLVNQCDAAGVAVYIKQLDINGKANKNPAEWPPDLRRQEYPGETYAPRPHASD